MPNRDPFAPPPERAVFCNRTLNMRSIQAIGFDMDYTLVHYDVVAWEARAYAHVQQRLLQHGLPVRDLRFDPGLFARGLIVDQQLGNILKANRFGYVTQAAHGTRMLAHEAVRKTYSQVWVDLSEKRWVFLNTLFSLSEACLYGQLVDLHDAGRLGRDRALDYRGIYELVGETMDAAHLEGELKAEIVADPARYVPLEPELAQTLLDLKHAGKKLFLATNSEWHYTRPMMSWAFDRFLPGSGWRSLFDLVIVQAKKPSFFDGEQPFFAVVGDRVATEPHPGPLQPGQAYKGGNAQLVQEHFGLAGEEILYVGDHVYADVHVSSQIRRWRTALVLREVEDEVRHEQAFAPDQARLLQLMQQKERLDHEQAALRLTLQRLEHRQAPPNGVAANAHGVHERLRALRTETEALDHQIAPLARAAGELGHPRWGPLMRAGNDKSRLARQIERHADVYTSRVSNFLWLTPFGYLRAARGSLPHDPPATSQPR
ncbi:MAG: HAD-IG family 5'-nucleotidase [Planctomycetes bacterium]|nr:HAD-IG family 5'-nucleotidase [Planctomycetota bacterium]